MVRPFPFHFDTAPLCKDRTTLQALRVTQESSSKLVPLLTARVLLQGSRCRCLLMKTRVERKKKRACSRARTMKREVKTDKLCASIAGIRATRAVSYDLCYTTLDRWLSCYLLLSITGGKRGASVLRGERQRDDDGCRRSNDHYLTTRTQS